MIIETNTVIDYFKWKTIMWMLTSVPATPFFQNVFSRAKSCCQKTTF